MNVLIFDNMNSIDMAYLIVMATIILIYTGLESIIYLLSKMSSTVVYISLGFNVLALLLVGLLFLGEPISTERIIMMILLITLPIVYSLKIFMLNWHDSNTKYISILVSMLMYGVMFIWFINAII